MSVHDLAIDVGLAKNSDEYDTFVSCVHNILELGTGYTRPAMENIVEKCRKSELDIAKRVIRECQREKTSPMRSRRLKWWEEYVPKHERITRDIVIDRTPKREHKQRDQRKRPMSPMFERRKRPMSPMFERRDQRKRPMKPMFERRKRPHEPRRDQRKRPMKSMFERRKRPESPVYTRQPERYSSREPERYSTVPQWGSDRRPDKRERSPPYRRNNKRRRY